MNEKITCSKHGAKPVTFICQHLVKGEDLGFNLGYDPDDPYCLYPDAWCDECDKVLDAEGGWNDVSEKFSDIQVICADCYLQSRERNWRQDEASYQDLVCSGCAYLNEKQQLFIDTFKVNQFERWDWCQDSGQLIFSHDGKPQVVAEISFSGTLSTQSNKWMWAWANDSLLEPVKTDAKKMLALGEELGFVNLVAGLWEADEVDGWEMTSIMAETLNAIGAYRTLTDNCFTYMIVKKAYFLNEK